MDSTAVKASQYACFTQFVELFKVHIELIGIFSQEGRQPIQVFSN